jgi:hypothetical protein
VQKQQAVAVAKREVTNHGWTNITVESVHRVDGNWRVEIWWLPKTPGGFTEIDVSDSGAVVAEYPGY